MKVFNKSEYLEKMASIRKSNESMTIVAMYNSIIGGVVTDESLMTVPVDDRIVGRGHAVFDTCTFYNGYLYRLTSHLKRFMTSAKEARIPLPYSGGEDGNIEKMRETDPPDRCDFKITTRECSVLPLSWKW